MHKLEKNQLAVFLTLIVVSLLSGCTNYRQKYEGLLVDHKNLESRHETQQSQFERDRQALSERISQDQLTIEELRRRIEEMDMSPGAASGFGEGLDVQYDAAAGTVTVTLPNTILFASGSAALKNKTTELDQVISVLKSQYSGRRVDVVGHTDTDPIRRSGWKDNWELSTERALSVVRYLVQNGISDNLVRPCGGGSANPVAPNTNASGKAKNRRVEIVVYMNS
jgi:chemotaxis protein MotB